MISLSPLVNLRNFSFGRMFVRVTGGFEMRSRSGQLSIDSLNGNDDFYQMLGHPCTFMANKPGLSFIASYVTAFAGSADLGWLRFETWWYQAMPEWPFFTLSLTVNGSAPPWGVVYNPLPDVLANLDHFGQRLEVWRETEISGGSREWTRLFLSAPAAQVSIGPLQDAGFVDEDGYIVRMPESGWLPVFGRNALGRYSKIDQFNPSRAS